MKVGDLVMWLGKDEWHGMMGVIAKAAFNTNLDKWVYAVQWSDGVYGIALYEDEIMAVEDASR
jgi:hypothetical protein